MSSTTRGMLEGCTVGYFGHYQPGYPRNRILVKALRQAGASVVPINDTRTFLRRTPSLLTTSWRTPLDLLLVGFPSHSDMPAAKLVSLRKRVPVVFDPLVSLWEASVIDRGMASRISLAALRYRLTDRLACHLADLTLLDTEAHRVWFQEQYDIPADRCRRLWVGADDEVMKPAPRDGGDGTYTVFFYGTFIPLQGVGYILRAARLVASSDPHTRFVLCGTGQTYAEARSTAKELELRNVEFSGRRPPTELADLMARSDVCLGIFGTSPKTQRVIPNKVFDGLACRRAVVTADTPAARECLVHGEHAWLVPVGDPSALADALLQLRDDDTRDRLAEGGHRLFQQNFSIAALSSELAAMVHDVLRRT